MKVKDLCNKVLHNVLHGKHKKEKEYEVEED